MLAVKALQRRRLVAAGHAPGGPEVDQHPAPAVVGDAARALAVEAGEGLVRGRLADLDAGAALAEQAEAQQPDQGEHGDEGGERAGAHAAKVRDGPRRARVR